MTQVKFDLEKIENHLENPDWPLLIAGPCSAESEEQVMTIAKQLKATERISYYRAGIWKPRTRPNSFEGVGEIGLQWLQKVKKETGLLIATEIATPEHAELVLKYDIDLIWVGARTTVNPFAVQSIADALKGTNIPVLVKNPINPDIQLWIGALERLNKAGIKHLGAIHRGFSSSEPSVFRNAPMWNIAEELGTICPGLPIISDPSHICGNRELIPFIAQKALDMNADGLMIECHNNPSVALSDAAQQLVPKDYGRIIYDLMLRKASAMNVVSTEDVKLKAFREEIDRLDDEIYQSISLRMKVCELVGRYKKEKGLNVLQKGRWDEIMERRMEMGKAMGLNPLLVKNILELIHQESLDIQANIVNK